jgi:hypothetical protein
MSTSSGGFACAHFWSPLLLSPCSQGARRRRSKKQIGRRHPPGQTVVACNDVTPDAGRQVGIGEEVVTAAAASDLRGGSITPGTYDLVSATRVGAATGWSGTRAVALNVSEAQTGGVTFNWAGADPGGQADRWTATFTETPQPRIAYTCGRVGEVAADFAAQNNRLQLRLQDGAQRPAGA